MPTISSQAAVSNVIQECQSSKETESNYIYIIYEIYIIYSYFYILIQRDLLWFFILCGNNLYWFTGKKAAEFTLKVLSRLA